MSVLYYGRDTQRSRKIKKKKTDRCYTRNNNIDLPRPRNRWLRGAIWTARQEVFFFIHFLF